MSLKLSLWMIYNQLHDYDILINLDQTSNTMYDSIRLNQKAGCLTASQNGDDVLIYSKYECLTIKNANVMDMFSAVQDIYDDYDHWANEITVSIRDKEYSDVLERSHKFFKSPMIWKDENGKVLALSKQYPPDSLNDEWRYLYTYGITSIDVYKKYNNLRAKNKLAFYKNTVPEGVDLLSANIRKNGNDYGRFMIVQNERVLNHGDEQLLKILVDIIESNFGPMENSANKIYNFNLCLDILKGVEIDIDEYNYFLLCNDWDDNDLYYIVSIDLKNAKKDENSLSFYREYFKILVPNCIICHLEEYLVVICNPKFFNKKELVDKLKDCIDLIDSYIGVSLTFRGLIRANEFFKQANYAIQLGKRKSYKTGQCNIFYFYNYAIEFIIRSNNFDRKLCACHPEIIKLYKNDTIDNDHIHTLKIFLDEERSLLNASKKLNVHRNTFVYQIKKIKEMLNCDLNDSYTRQYISLSIKIIEMIKTKIKNKNV